MGLTIDVIEEEEKQKLFDIIKANGYKWNAETKTLEKVLEENKTFKNGDIIVSTFGNIAIFSHTKKNDIGRNVVYYHCLYSNEHIYKFKACIDCGIGYVEDCRLATEHEKKLMMEAIRESGFQWNHKTKTLEKLIVPKFKVGDIIQDKDGYKIRITEVNIDDELYGCESLIANVIGRFSFNEQNNWKLVIKPKFKIGDRIRTKNSQTYEIINMTSEYYSVQMCEHTCVGVLLVEDQDNWELIPYKFDPKTLKPFDKVLVRDIGYNMRWHIQFFESIHEYTKDYHFMCLGSKLYSFCIPYNDDTKHLVEKSEEAPEFYRYWEN